LTIASPLDPHKANTITFDMVAVDVGIENPQFACIECHYGDPEDKMSAAATGYGPKVLTFYEMDLGVNHVKRQYCTPVEDTAHMLIQVPGGNDGPSGIIVCSSGLLVYKKMNHEDITVNVPLRKDQLVEKGLYFNCSSSLCLKNQLFFIV
jgi:splicing factor 3B subunit 3